MQEESSPIGKEILTVETLLSLIPSMNSSHVTKELFFSKHLGAGNIIRMKQLKPPTSLVYHRHVLLGMNEYVGLR